MKNLQYASEILEQKINDEVAKSENAQASSTLKADSKRRAKNNCKNIVTLLDALKNASELQETKIDIVPSSNIGEVTEAVVKSLLDRGYTKAEDGEYDLVLANGRRYEIKTLVVGSSRKPSSLNYNVANDVTLMVVSNKGIRVVKREYWEDMKSKGYVGSEDRLSAKVFEYEHCVQTAFTKRLEQEWGLGC